MAENKGSNPSSTGERVPTDRQQPSMGHDKKQEGDRPLGGQSTTDKERDERAEKKTPPEAAVRSPGESTASTEHHPEAEIPVMQQPPQPNPAAPTQHQEPIGEDRAQHHDTPRDKERR